MRGQMIGGLALGRAARHVHIGKGVVLNLHAVEVQAQAEGELEAVGEQEVRLMEKGEVHRRRTERLWYGHLSLHRYAADGSLYSLVGSSLSLFSSHSLRHTRSHHLLKHLLIHTRIHRLTHGTCHGIGDGIAYGAGNGLTKVNRGIGAQPLIGTKETCSMLPTVAVMRADNELLREGIHLLTLLELQVVRRHIVLVHKHTVL